MISLAALILLMQPPSVGVVVEPELPPATAGNEAPTVTADEAADVAPPAVEEPASATSGEVPPDAASAAKPQDNKSPDSDASDTKINFAASSEASAPIEWATASPSPEALKYASDAAQEEKIKYVDDKNHVPTLDGGANMKSAYTGPTPFHPDKQRFALEIRLGPYRPGIDDDYAGAGDGPFRSVFGKRDSTGNAISAVPRRLLMGLGFDWQALHFAGPLAIGTSVSFYRISAPSILSIPPETEGASVRSEADETALRIVPLTLQLSYRFEWLADKYHIPVIPYAKAGLLYSFWWSSNGDGKLSTSDNNKKARGGVPGYQLNLGGMLRLSDFDRETSSRMTRSTGVNHFNLFGEIQISKTAGLGKTKRPNLGDKTWVAGVVTEF